MSHEIPPEDTLRPQDRPVAPPQQEPTPLPKKPFVPPVLTRHATLPDITTSFFGSFQPHG
jgi:hypothetical protein